MTATHDRPSGALAHPLSPAVKKALIVDDDPMIVKLQSMILGAAGYEIDSAADGQEGLDRATQGRPDVILLDVMMPGLDGLEVTRRLKADPRTGAIPIVLVSARTGAEEVAAGKAAGAAYYVKKPFDPDDLIALLDQLIAED
jgi:CheY-like chemotaxis protein